MKTPAVVAIVIGAAAAPALAEQSVVTTRYACDRGVQVPATYINDSMGGGVAVINVEGRQITLMTEPSAYGARYGWPSGGSNYVWWTKGDEATLYWRDGTAGTEEPVLGGCKETG